MVTATPAGADATTGVLPRVLVAAPSSGSGKTMIATGLIAALRERGLVVSPHKVGPDYIDPGYHTVAAGRPGRNLDAHLVGEDRLVPLLLHGATTPVPADVAVIEGVMGLFDGALGSGGFASSAHVATRTRTPVVLVVNCASASRSVGAVVHGFSRFDPDVRIGGVILNNVGSARHEAEARAGVEETGVPVVGAVPRLPDVVVPSRHLGLIPAAERRPEALSAVASLAAMAREHLDLDHILTIARGAVDLAEDPWDPRQQVSAAPRPVRIAVAGGAAFTFGYAETPELLQAAGAELVDVDPLRDDALPAGVDGLVIGGGFPEAHAAALGGNRGLLEDVRRFVDGGGPVVAECAGMLYLCEQLDGVPMVGVLPAVAAMSPRLRLGYRRAVAITDSIVGAVGERVSGHEFHRTRVRVDPRVRDTVAAAWGWERDGEREVEGFVYGSVHASYLHTHWAGHPGSAESFVAACVGRGQ